MSRGNKIAGYRIIRSGAPDELTAAVGAAIEEGWEPVGPAQVAVNQMNISQYVQTLILREGTNARA